MTTDESILQEMLDRATNPAKETVDELGVQMFCMVVRSNSQLVHKAHEMLVAKIRSNNITESIRAIELLEECMTKCGADFQDEVAKFRFLNDLIRLVSTKYQGAETPASIKQRIMECLLLWTTEFPQKAKIREAYDMLTKEGGVEHSNRQPSASVARQECILGIDEQMLTKLLQSGNPENYKRANLLIQCRVNQETRRNEYVLQHKSTLQEVENTVSLLSQLLDTYEADGSNANEESINLIREIYMACKKHKPIMQRLPELIELTNEELIDDTLEANGLLQAVMKRYKDLVVHPSAKINATLTAQQSNNCSAAPSHTDLLKELLSDLPLTTATNEANNDRAQADVAAVITPIKAAKSNTYAELHDIFGNDAAESTEQSSKLASELLSSLDLLEPVSVFPTDNDTNEKLNGLSSVNQSAEKRVFRELKEIDQLSEDLFKQSLTTVDRIIRFKKDPEKVTLNDMVKEKRIIKPATATSNASMKTTDYDMPKKNNLQDNTLEVLLTAKPAAEEPTTDVLMLSNDDPIDSNETKVVGKNLNSNTSINITELPLKHLSDITIDLDDVLPTPEERILLDDDDVKITFSFTENRPSQHVSVVVISAVNFSKLCVKDFQFEASVKKPSKVRLLPPTTVSMSAYKRFCPPTPINQVMLLYNPTGKAVDVTCIVGYKLGDDPDAIKESIVAKDIPFVE